MLGDQTRGRVQIIQITAMPENIELKSMALCKVQIIQITAMPENHKFSFYKIVAVQIIQITAMPENCCSNYSI